MTYLEVVNAVLRRLREREVTTVNQTEYSKLIGDFVNAAKAEVENAWDWQELRYTITASTSLTTPPIFNFVLPGAETRFRVLDVINDTSNFEMQYRDRRWFNNVFLNQTPESGPPRYYNFNGVDEFGNQQVDLYPVPDGNYDIRFNLVVPQPRLVNDSDPMWVPWLPVVEGAFARAIHERGEDGANGSDFQYREYYRVLSDQIAIQAHREPEVLNWNPV